MYFAFQTQVLSKQFSTAFYFALFIFLSEQFFFRETSALNYKFTRTAHVNVNNIFFSSRKISASLIWIAIANLKDLLLMSRGNRTYQSN
jgi:hypothetical protein